MSSFKTIATEEITIGNPLLLLHDKINTSGEPDDIHDIGIVGKYWNGFNRIYTGLYRDATDSGIWKFFDGITDNLNFDTGINITGLAGHIYASIQISNLIANNGDFSGDVNIQGDTIISGNNITLNAQTIIHEDNIIVSNSGPLNMKNDGGYVIKRIDTNIVSDTPIESNVEVGGVYTHTTITFGGNGSPAAMGNTNDYYNGWYIKFSPTTITTALQNIIRRVVDYTSTNKVFTLDNVLPDIPVSGDQFNLYNKVYVGTIWDESSNEIALYTFPREDLQNELTPESNDGSAPSYLNFKANNIFANGNIEVDGSIICNGDVIFNSCTNIIRTYYITNESCLTANGGNTKWILSPGFYIFDKMDGTTFSLTKPFELPNSGYIRISANVDILYIGSGVLFENTTISGQLILQFNNLTLIGSNNMTPSKQLFNLKGTGVTADTMPLLICNTTYFKLWDTIGVLENFNKINLINFNLYNTGTAGLEIKNLLNYFNLNGGECSGGSNTSNFDYIKFTGVTNITGTYNINNINYIPTGINERFINLLNTQTPNVNVNNCIMDNKLIGSNPRLFWRTGGLDQKSIYVLSRSNKNILPSRISCELHGTDTNGVVTITSTKSQWGKILAPTLTFINNERIIQEASPNLEIVTITSLETDMIHIRGYLNMKTSFTTAYIEIQTAILGQNVATTANSSTDTFTSNSHGLIDDDLIYFYATTFPNGITQGKLYYIKNATANTYQITEIIGGSIVNYTTNGSGIFHSKVRLVGVANIRSMDNSFFGPSATEALTEVSTNDRIIFIYRNNTNTRDIISQQFYIQIWN